VDINNEQKSDKFWELMHSEVFRTPLYGNYPVWDSFMYRIMCKDSICLNAYKTAITKMVKDKIVLDLGTGESLPLALLCVEGGAKLVYALDENRTTVEKAQRFIEQLGLCDKIRLIHGSATEVELPEKVDICVSEIIGTIGSCEGAIVVLENAKKFLKEGGKHIPERCTTYFAPVASPGNLYQDELLTELIDHYTPLVYQVRNKTFPFTRFKFYQFPKSNILARAEIFEDIWFNQTLTPNFTSTATFFITADNVFDGFLFWLDLYVDAETVVNTFAQTCWGMAFIPCEQPLAVKANDVIEATCAISVGENGINPDYRINGIIRCDRNVVESFAITSLW